MTIMRTVLLCIVPLNCTFLGIGISFNIKCKELKSYFECKENIIQYQHIFILIFSPTLLYTDFNET
jgi:hypothetical protein